MEEKALVQLVGLEGQVVELEVVVLLEALVHQAKAIMAAVQILYILLAVAVALVVLDKMLVLALVQKEAMVALV